MSHRSAARVILALLPGYLLQRSWYPDLDPGDFTTTAQALFSAPSSRCRAQAGRARKRRDLNPRWV